MAVRAALGARRARLVRQLLVESLVLALAGGALGVLLAVFGVRAIVAIGVDSIPRVDDVHVSGLVLAFAVLTTVATSVLFGLVPALRGGTIDVQATLRRGGRAIAGGGLRLRRVLVAVEIALAMIVALGAGLLIRSFGELLRVDPGFDGDGVLVASVNLPQSRYEEAGRTLAFQSAIEARLSGTPGVTAMGVASSLPLADSPPNVDFDIEGAEARGEGAPVTSGDLITATPGYDRAIGARMARGRFFGPADGRTDPPVAVVNATAARLFWPGDDPVGRRIRVADSAPWLTIVGVIDDVRYQGLDAEPRQAWYVPDTQAEASFGSPVRTMKLALRTVGDPLALADVLRSSIREVDAELPVVGLRTMDEVVAGSVAGPRFTMVLLSLFAGVALLLGGVGIYGVIAYTVSQRRKELGIRMALGAGYRDTTGMVLAQGMKLMAMGLLLGVVGALALTRLLSGLLFGVRPNDPLTFIAVSLVLASIGALACWIPARRAKSVDLLAVLRSD
jgi:predicted permease